MPTTLGERQIALVVHHVLCAYDDATTGYSVPWDALSLPERKAVVNVVRNVKRADPWATPAELHDAWVERRIAQGWRWGPTLSHENKAHPYMVPWEQLGERERVREHLMVGTVHCLMRPIPNQG